MSAPKTNIERQKRNHRGPLIGMAVALFAVGALFVIFLGNETSPDSSLLGGGATEVAPEAVGTIAPEVGGIPDVGPESDADTLPEAAGTESRGTLNVDPTTPDNTVPAAPPSEAPVDATPMAPIGN